MEGMEILTENERIYRTQIIFWGGGLYNIAGGNQPLYLRARSLAGPGKERLVSIRDRYEACDKLYQPMK